MSLGEEQRSRLWWDVRLCLVSRGKADLPFYGGRGQLTGTSPAHHVPSSAGGSPAVGCTSHWEFPTERRRRESEPAKRKVGYVAGRTGELTLGCPAILDIAICELLGLCDDSCNVALAREVTDEWDGRITLDELRSGEDLIALKNTCAGNR